MTERGTGVLVLGVLAATMSSCASHAARLTVPDASAVGNMVVRCPYTDEDLERELVVDDPRAVERFLAFLQAHNDGWRKPWDTFPTPLYTVSLERDKELLLAVWVGTNWIGGREGSGGSGERLRTLSDRERAEVLGILGILPSDPGVAGAPAR